jgi:hypothetical protein
MTPSIGRCAARAALGVFLALWALGALAASGALAQGGSFLRSLLSVTGISATPSAQKGPGDELEAGDVWIASPAQGSLRRLTREGGYRSPVFGPGDQSVLALRQGALVTIPPGGGEGAVLHALARASKLAGLRADGPPEVLAVFEEADGSAWLGFVSLAAGQVTPLPHDRASREHRAMIAHVRDWERVYGGATLYVKTESKQGMAGFVEWTDVYLARGAEPVNVSRCDGVPCGQPSLSQDGRHVVFVKAPR